jgi:hypothetical protein
MSFYTKDNKTIFFSHIPKTGGSSVNSFLISNTGYNRTFWGGYNGNNISLHHRHAKDEELLKEKNNYNIIYQFTIIRNPVERFFSEFFMRQHHHNKTCEDFHNFVLRITKEYVKNQNLSDNHIRPQYEFIHDNMDIYKFGEWDKLIKNLSTIDEVFLKDMVHINHSTNLKNSTEFIKKELGWKPKEETINIIKEFYNEDYKLFQL